MKMTFEVDQSSINETLIKLSKWDLALRKDLDKEARKAANDVKKDAKSRIHNVTGNLQTSIGVRKISDLSFTVFPRTAKGKKGYHRHLLEYGTIKMRPRPFMRPAEDKVATGYEARMRKVLSSHDKTI
jgi:HK97 gp10 family phage protein